MFQWTDIRHLHLVDGVPKKEITRRLKLDSQDGAAAHRAIDAAGAGVAAAAAVDGEADSTVAAADGESVPRTCRVVTRIADKFEHVCGWIRSPTRCGFATPGGGCG